MVKRRWLRRCLHGAFRTTALALLLSGCEAGPPADWSTTTDTLPDGAVHTINTPPEGELGPTWVIEEDLRIGTADGEGPESFGQVRGIAVTDEGHIVVLDAIAQELRVFDAEGNHLVTHGGKGEGPGEFESAYGLMTGSNGELWVPDHASARMSVFDPEDGFSHSYRMRVLSYGFIWRGVLDTLGRVLKPSITLGPDRKNVLRVFGSDMTLTDSLPLHDRPTVDRKNPPGAFFWEAPDGRSSGYIGVPFYPQGVQLIDPRGEIWSTYPGDPSYRVIRWIPGGDTTLVLESRRAAVTIPASVRDSIIDELRKELRQRGAANQDWSKVPETKPAVESLFVADEGNLWVRIATPDGQTDYDVFDRDGRFSGTASTSMDVYRWLRPIVRGDRYWAVVTDDLDVPFVVRGTIQPARGSDADH